VIAFQWLCESPEYVGPEKDKQKHQRTKQTDGNIQQYLWNVIFSDHFSGPGTALGPSCVCVGVSRQ